MNLITAITAIVLHFSTQSVDIYVGSRVVARCYAASGQQDEHGDITAHVVCKPA